MSNPRDAIAAAIALLAERWPKCFAVYEARRRPLKLGIHKNILAVVDGALTPLELGKALGVYTANAAYLRSLRAGAARIDLDGSPVGAVTTDESEQARVRLAARNRPVTPPPTPKRLSLTDLKAAAQARRASQSTA